MGIFVCSRVLFVSIAVLAGAVNVELRVNLLRRAVPKAGLAVTITSSRAAYEKECDAGGLMPMLEPSAKGKIGEVDEEGEGSVLFVGANGDEAWVPIRAMVGFENWRKGQPDAPPPAAAAGAAAPGPAPMAAAPVQAVDTSPTDFMSSGCQQIGKVVDGYINDIGMSSVKCFTRCKKQKGMKYFGMTKGGICFCSKLPPGRLTSKSRCDTRCSGSPREFCGGVRNVANVYTMVNCDPPSAQEKGWIAQANDKKLAELYGVQEGQTCAQTKNKACELNGSAKMNGTPEECKIACWNAKGAEKCDGFTYNAVVSRCKFFKDVLDGQVKKKPGLSCYYKKLGYPM